MTQISLDCTIDAGHRVAGHKGKCARLHGHTYKFAVILEADVLVEPGFVVDFGDIKDLIREWDHRLLLWDEDPFWQEFGGIIPNIMAQYGIVNVHFNPTIELMCEYLAEEIMCSYLNLTKVTVHGSETAHSHAKVIRERA